MTQPSPLSSLLLLFVLAAPAAAQESARHEPDARERRRVIELAGGQTVRVLSRWNADHWEYQSQGTWKSIAPGQVIAVTLESELLREWDAKRAASPKPDADARVVLAKWAAEHALSTEALGELDRALEASPDHAGALALLASREWMRMPDAGAPPAAGTKCGPERDAFYRFAATLPTASREVAVQALERASDRTGLAAELSRELGSQIIERRRFAALAMRRLCAGEAVQPLLRRAVLDASVDVRRDASLALRAAQDPALVLPVVRALTSNSPIVRVNAAEALGMMGYAAAVEPLVAHLASASKMASDAGRLPHSSLFIGRQVAYVQDYDVEVAQGASIANPQVATVLEGSVLDAAAVGVQEVSFTVECSAVRRSLARLTGDDQGSSNKAWLAWWKEHGSAWRSAGHAAPPAVTTSSALR